MIGAGCPAIRKRMASYVAVGALVASAIVVAAWQHLGGVGRPEAAAVWVLWTAAAVPLAADRVGEDARGLVGERRVDSTHFDALQKRHWLGTMFGVGAAAYAAIVTAGWFGGDAVRVLPAVAVAVASTTFLTVVHHACAVEHLMAQREQRRLGRP